MFCYKQQVIIYSKQVNVTKYTSKFCWYTKFGNVNHTQIGKKVWEDLGLMFGRQRGKDTGRYGTDGVVYKVLLSSSIP